MNQETKNENLKKADKTYDSDFWRSDESEVMITTGEFVERLKTCERINSESNKKTNLTPRQEGWIEEQDELNWEDELERGAAARIIHMFMKVKLGIKDEEDISEAYMLRDLFDCRVCANHIAQIYVRGIMEAIHIGSLSIFDVHGKVTVEEAEEILGRLSEEHGNGDNP